MTTFDHATAALESRDWSGAEVDYPRRSVKVVQSIRMPRALAEKLFTEAHRRSVTPSELIYDLVDRHLEDERR